MKQKILKLIAILIIGGLGGVLADQFFLPYLAGFPPFSGLGFIQRAKDGTTIINKTEKIVVIENTAVEEAIKKISSSVVAVQAVANKKIIKEGTGFIVFSDGLVITTADLISQRADYLVFRENSSSTARVVKKDLKNNLALLKINETNLPVVSLANLSELFLGERIVLIGAQVLPLLEKTTGEVRENKFYRFINIGTIRGIQEEIIFLNLDEESFLANGGPLVNIKGEVIGLNLVNQNGLVNTVPVTKIKELID
ncbi:MAG: hypothetical protein A3I88_02805 [Candidatus Portnoybacteria bacterium RIFCSPLOWO2_12_FULL_39_9]|uniref:Serine protease n=1 Tax=Candidatus Portnoybacteria bacterium RIFCSPHIGHO2_12_FULL_38_9 TaxID=1801997 RepID=A0A1G2FEY8_9BACT|nr:MAG: hypothetical protein A3H00_00840 [Candidatus Portnoybacteria bacterium RBG_13_40_8]OGZ36367.1 MAG: hypothetical protein A3J64_01840 [Candidatus Portnoybacteria bacterium RIFCSPHIGHO2_12_FULL_38_9]OGZ36823.1 MAG: hypothetical protein A2646_03750 [Candidatus Portnoybacteria bacterium RIFCSPHIGHO2_02_FULL_39_12]OGZ40167.1 MAG: hypothetical protein A3I88_02805 [Candidatus Portnoybacteria bacterium RIFCSPLOWO2_12_FULL_39_9]